ncbi:probable pre-mRNA-splicing factor ATP-dependent RNA helicase DEAH5 [Morus notabilis]|nr:probable pre-mRNA-splicing factor ATP-dependent RNA helicase DEAH5 [Morus notabilis]
MGQNCDTVDEFDAKLKENASHEKELRGDKWVIIEMGQNCDAVDGLLYQEEGAEEELEIELNEDVPAFLNGQSRYSVDMSPVKIFKNPEGSLSRAAALQSALIKERMEVREQQQRTMLDSIPKDLNRPWEDPMPETGERHLAQELRGVGLSAYDMPEWKKDAFGKTISFGQRSKLSIQEQRQKYLITHS